MVRANAARPSKLDLRDSYESKTPSNLSKYPPSPSSPRFPITPPALLFPRRITQTVGSQIKSSVELSPPPSAALHWLWQCHRCNRVYQLGVTRRCLDDGHYFCAGTTMKRDRKTGRKTVKKHNACASEFDYQGWKAFGVWRRSVIEQAGLAAEVEAALAGADEDVDVVMPLNVAVAPHEGQWLNGAWTRKPAIHSATKNYWGKDCWNTCDYPSECRWGKQYGVQTPVKATTTVPSSPPSTLPSEKEDLPKITFDDILLETSMSQEASVDHLEHITEPTTVGLEALERQSKKPSMDDLLESVKRRKRKSGGLSPSPLGSHPPSAREPEVTVGKTSDAQLAASTGSTASNLQKALDDFELDVRRGFERAGDLMIGWACSIRTTAALEEEKAEAFVKGLKLSKKR